MQLPALPPREITAGIVAAYTAAVDLHTRVRDDPGVPLEMRRAVSDLVSFAPPGGASALHLHLLGLKGKKLEQKQRTFCGAMRDVLNACPIKHALDSVGGEDVGWIAHRLAERAAEIGVTAQK